MGEPQASIVSQWNGIDARGRDLKSTRKTLDAPRSLRNIIVDEHGHLLMPAASTLIHSFASGDGAILQMLYIEDPRGILVQMESGKVYHFNLPTTGNWSPGNLEVTNLTTLSTDEFIWAISSVGEAIFGNAGRGSTTDGQTFTVQEDEFGTVTATDISANDLPANGQASYSVLWKGRRFVIVRGRRVWFSALNEHNTFPEENTFRIGGDDGGNDYVSNPGFVQGMTAWEDILLFFLQSSVWMLSGGGDPDTWQLRDTIPSMGNITSRSLQATQSGVFTFGGGNQGDREIYVFQGSSAKKISEPVSSIIGGRISAAQQFGYYILHTARTPETSIQVLLFDMDTNVWTSFDGYRQAVSAPSPHGFFISDDRNLYFVPSGSGTPKAFPRKPGRPASIVLGWEDEGHPNGLNRYLGVKLSGKKSGGNPTVQVSATVPAGITYTSPAVQVTGDTFDGLLLPLRFRGPAIEIELTITPDTDADEVLIESLELIHSRKGEKVSRH